MENLLKTIIGSNFKGTLEIFDREEIDLEAFWNLTSLHLKEMGKHYIWVDSLDFDSLPAHMVHILNWFFVSKKSYDIVLQESNFFVQLSFILFFAENKPRTRKFEKGRSNLTWSIKKQQE